MSRARRITLVSEVVKTEQENSPVKSAKPRSRAAKPSSTAKKKSK